MKSKIKITIDIDTTEELANHVADIAKKNGAVQVQFDSVPDGLQLYFFQNDDDHSGRKEVFSNSQMKVHVNTVIG